MSQIQKIFNHLKHYGSITPIQALNKYGSLRLASRILELRGMGHQIETEMIEREGKRFARYRYARGER